MSKPLYFSGLNGIRAIASIIVVVWHIDQFSGLFNLDSIGFYKTGMANRAVDMFFVLSGFLITYLLFLEKDKTGTINLKKFYLRRILRIWPLYYLALIVSLFLIYFEIIPNIDNLSISIFLYAFLMANVAYVLGIVIPSITPLWSVGVEEQFYLLWPNIIKRAKNYLKVFVYFYIIFFIAKIVLFKTLTANSSIVQLFYETRLNIMALGGIGAYFVYTKHTALKFIYRKEIQIVSWLVLIISCVYKPIHYYTIVDSEINSIFYLILILNVSSNSKTLISLDNKLMNFIGKISYGIYVYHMILIFLFAKITSYFSLRINHTILYFSILILTICIAAVSYSYFEMPFLKIKKRFIVIKSTNVKK